jgi:hypothetical protein
MDGQTAGLGDHSFPTHGFLRETRRRRVGMMAGYYTQVKISVTPELAAAFKNVCHDDDASITGELSRFMAKRAGLPSAPASSLGTRRQRRRELAKLIGRLDVLLENERRYMDNIPENLQGANVKQFFPGPVSRIFPLR